MREKEEEKMEERREGFFPWQGLTVEAVTVEADGEEEEAVVRVSKESLLGRRESMNPVGGGEEGR